MPASVRVRVTHLLLRVLSRARECSLARSAFWHASVSRVSRERLARFVTFLVSGTVHVHDCVNKKKFFNHVATFFVVGQNVLVLSVFRVLVNCCYNMFGVNYKDYGAH